MSLFKGIVKLNENQYQFLKENGYLDIDDLRIYFDEDTLYVTDYVEPKIKEFAQIKIVESLPDIGDSSICYWKEKNDDSGIYDQYIWINDRFAYAGSTQISLIDYVKKEELPTKLPASDVYDWAKSATKPDYELNEILTDKDNIDIGGNSIMEQRHLSITRNVSNIAYQLLITIGNDGSVRISRRNKNSNLNEDDSFLEFSPSKLKYGEKDIITSEIGYTKEEIDAKIEELKSLIKGQ